jgi:uncharacterized membrane protein YadS
MRVFLMGATISFGAILAVGWPLLLGIVATVIAAIVCSFTLGNALGLGRNGRREYRASCSFILRQVSRDA